jgi:hypothetical protein
MLYNSMYREPMAAASLHPEPQGVTVATARSVDADSVEFIRLGFQRDVSLDFRVPIRDWETFAAAMAAVGGYEEFSGAEVVDTFRELFDDAAIVYVGREDSVVLYVELPYWTHQRTASDVVGRGEKYTDEQLRELARRVIAWARSLRVDEVCSYECPGGEPVWNGTGDRPHRIRLWWD